MWFEDFTSYIYHETVPQELRLILMEATMNYGLYGIEPKFTGAIERNTFFHIKTLIDIAKANYEERRKINSKNGKKGGAPKGSRNNPNGRRGKAAQKKDKEQTERLDKEQTERLDNNSKNAPKKTNPEVKNTSERTNLTAKNANITNCNSTNCDKEQTETNRNKAYNNKNIVQQYLSSPKGKDKYNTVQEKNIVQQSADLNREDKNFEGVRPGLGKAAHHQNSQCGNGCTENQSALNCSEQQSEREFLMTQDRAAIAVDRDMWPVESSYIGMPEDPLPVPDPQYSATPQEIASVMRGISGNYDAPVFTSGVLAQLTSPIPSFDQVREAITPNVSDAEDMKADEIADWFWEYNHQRKFPCCRGKADWKAEAQDWNIEKARAAKTETNRRWLYMERLKAWRNLACRYTREMTANGEIYEHPGTTRCGMNYPVFMAYCEAMGWDRMLFTTSYEDAQDVRDFYEGKWPSQDDYGTWFDWFRDNCRKTVQETFEQEYLLRREVADLILNGEQFNGEFERYPQFQNYALFAGRNERSLSPNGRLPRSMCIDPDMMKFTAN